MKHLRSLIFCGLCGCLLAPLGAERRDMSDVERIARTLLPITSSDEALSSGRVLRRLSAGTDEISSFYLFRGADNQGFVLVSADDRMPEILGWSPTDYFPDLETMPVEVRSFLGEYDAILRALDEGLIQPEEAFAPISLTAGTPEEVEPLLADICYDQGAPFNNKCPMVNGDRCLTGCVATAIAQIMTYYQYPAVGTGQFIVAAAGSSYSQTVDLDAMPFDWANMPHANYMGITEAEKNAVATLMLACGAAVRMDYGRDASGSNAPNARDALINNFGYSRSKINYVNTEAAIPYDDWIPALVDEFVAGRPVFYSGSAGTDGHAFVLDGYQGIFTGKVKDVLFHVNWGWGGHWNGYFALNSLKYADDQPNYAQFRKNVIFGIAPESASAVEDVESALSEGVIYNLLGQPVDASRLTPGTIYISNGQKFLFR